MKFSQGHLPSCQTLSAIGALWRNEKSRRKLETMVAKKQEIYEVTFPAFPDKPIIVSPQEYDGKSEFEGTNTFLSRGTAALTREFGAENYHWLLFQDRPSHVSGDELMRVLEIAYAKYQKLAHPQSFAGIAADVPFQVYRNSKFHYQADESLRDFTGWKVDTLAAGESTSDASRSFEQYFKTKNELLSNLKRKFEYLSANWNDTVATACTIGKPGSRKFLDPGGKIQPWHDHIIAAVDIAAETIHLIDPYNSRITMILHWEDFYQYFYLVANAKVE